MKARIPPIERRQADPRSEAEFERIESLGGYVPNMHLTFGAHPDLYAAWLPFAVHVMPNSSLPARDRQLLILGTSFAWRAIYPWSHHARISEALRALTSDEVARIESGPDHASWSSSEAALLRACLETRNDGRIAEETWKTLAAHFSHKQLLDIVFTIGQYTLIATALNSLQVELDAGFEAPAWIDAAREEGA
ncbi:MAG TPA: carboxymuconolactone decarboxylase family protein [Myxococcota bacterium]|jgi:alkylhydroperoxidase family enzyme